MNKRIEFVDELRGLAILFMIIFHTIYQTTVWLNMPKEILSNPFIGLFQLGAQFLFIMISGVSCSFSRSNYKRGTICILCGILITVITYIIIPKEIIIFGILHFLGFSMIIYQIIKRLLFKIESILGMVISLTCFIFSYLVTYRMLFLEQIKSIYPINFLWENGYLILLGIPSPTFYSADYFPFIPWLFLFICGIFCGDILKSKIHTFKEQKLKLHILSALGRHSLIIYLIHIPIIIVVLLALNYVMKIR